MWIYRIKVQHLVLKPKVIATFTRSMGLDENLIAFLLTMANFCNACLNYSFAMHQPHRIEVM